MATRGRPKKIKVEQEDYSLVLSCSGKKLNYTGATVLECLNQINSEIEPIKGFALIKVLKGFQSYEMRLFPLQIKRLIVNPNYKLILDKRFTQILK